MLETGRRAPHTISLRSRHEQEIWSDAGRKQLVQSQIDLNEAGSGVSLLDLKGRCLGEQEKPARRTKAPLGSELFVQILVLVVC